MNETKYLRSKRSDNMENSDLNVNYFCFCAICLLYEVPALASARKSVYSRVFQD